MVKNLTVWRPEFDLWVGKPPWRREWQPTPVFLLGEFHGQRSMAGYSSWGHKESDKTEGLTLLLSIMVAEVVHQADFMDFIYSSQELLEACAFSNKFSISLY